jgi:hypothetical protein
VGDEVGTQGPLWVDDFLRLEGPADEELQVVAAVRRDGSLAGGLVHFACHPTLMGHEAVYSADFAGALAEQLARRHGGTFLFVQGASAQLWWADVSTPRDDPRPAVERTQQLADALADATARALDAARAVDAGRVGISSRTLEIAQRRPTREQVELAAWFLCQEEDAVDLREFSRRIYGHPFTFYVNHWTIERWFCRDMIGMWEWQRRGFAGAPADRVEIQVMSIGDVAVVGYPAEMFTEFGLHTKARSPFATTLPCGLANGWVGYVPTRAAFEHGGYEPRFGYQSRLAPDAGELMTATAIEQLHALAGRS